MTLNSTIKALVVALVAAVVAYLLHPLLTATVVSKVGFALVVSGFAIVTAIATLLLTIGTPSLPQETISVFVGNLAFKATTEELRQLFANYGKVESVRIMVDKMTRKPRGFGFVEMGKRDAARAIAALDGSEFVGRTLRVNEGKSRRDHDNGE